MRAIKIQVGGITLEFTLDNHDFHSLLLDNYEAFLTHGEPDYRLAVRAFSMDIREDYAEPEADLSGARLTARRRDFTAELDLDQKRGTLDVNDNIYAFESFHRVLYSLLMLRHDGFVVHCCSLIKEGRGYMFIGLSQSGKSTLYRISPGSVLLSDEMAVVRKLGGNFHVYGTPFWGDFRKETRNRHVPLHALYFLCQDKSNFTRPVSAGEAVMRVMRNILFFSRDRARSSRLFTLCSEFVGGVTAKELHFLPEPSVWDVMD